MARGTASEDLQHQSDRRGARAYGGDPGRNGGLRLPSVHLAILLVGHLALGLLYDWATPIFEASDEGSHYPVVRWVAQSKSLPVQRPDEARTPWEQEGSQPPLYYVLAAALTKWIDTGDFVQLHVKNPH